MRVVDAPQHVDLGDACTYAKGSGMHAPKSAGRMKGTSSFAASPSFLEMVLRLTSFSTRGSPPSTLFLTSQISPNEP